MKTRNYVAKYSKEFNRATVQTDKKKNLKKGYEKHKGEHSRLFSSMFV